MCAEPSLELHARTIRRLPCVTAGEGVLHTKPNTKVQSTDKDFFSKLDDKFHYNYMQMRNFRVGQKKL